MASIKGTQTEQNLLKSFAGESQARTRYTFFASQAKKEGYEQIAAIFMETAEQEKEHAKRFFKFLEGGMVEITAAYPAGVIGDTAANLEAAAAGENEEWSELYPQFAAIADEEGFPAIAAAWRNIAKVEAYHEKRYRSLYARVADGEVFLRKDEIVEITDAFSHTMVREHWSGLPFDLILATVTERPPRPDAEQTEE
jgi:rubrerythrin